MDFNTVFPLQVYINLNKRDDRRRAVENGFLNAGLDKVRRFPAIDSRQVGHSRGHQTPGRYALALSQKLCVREAKRRRASALMIFEDDVVMHPDFQQRIGKLELPEDWGIFYLGAQHVKEPQSAGPGLVRVSSALDTHAVAIRAEYYRQVMQALSPQGKSGNREILPSDWLLAGLHRQIPTYAAFPNLAWQRSDNFSNLRSGINGTYDSRGFQIPHPDAWLPALRRHLDMTGWSAASDTMKPHTNIQKKIAFLFLSRGIPNQAQLWTEYLAGHEGRFSVYSHCYGTEEPGLGAPLWWRNADQIARTSTK